MRPPIDLKALQLKPYSIELPFFRLKLGVDNVRYDVHLSSEFRKVTERFIFELIIKHSDASQPFIINPEINWFREIAEFQRLCTEILTDGVNQAKAESEIQIDFLNQTALVKMFTDEIQNQYEEAIQHCKNVIRKQEFSHQAEATMMLREELASIIQRKNQIIRKVGAELFEYFIEVQNDVNMLRTSNFGNAAKLPEELFSNPILQSATQSDGFFMIENYALMGHRLEDPVNYISLIHILTEFLNHFSPPSPENLEAAADDASEESPREYAAPQDSLVDGWLKHRENIDALFNCFESEANLKKLRRCKADPGEIRALTKTLRLRKYLLRQIYRKLSKENMISGIVAAYLMKPVFERYCPPLSPQECLQYLVVPKARKNTLRKLKRFKTYFGKTFPRWPLNRTIRQINMTFRTARKKYLVRFLKDLSRYHRDMRNHQMIREAMDSINLTVDEKIINLSRENHCLYEFRLAHEEVIDKKPIIRHSVIKADVRGSSAIIEQMKSKNLNPASNFSLNFFDPISKILSPYGAVKIFIEGDAVILSIFEYEDAPGRWYCVSRACGLAIRMLMIVKKYNRINRKKGLPALEIGVGIGFSNAPPTFFYDEETQIMISPAITEADRLSRCDKALRRHLSKENPPFSVYELQPDVNAETALLFNARTIRYNVKGIQLSAQAFKKLSKEIHLKRLECEIPELSKDPLILYTGKFPTFSGNFQRLIIREAPIPRVSLKDLSVMGQTDSTYYEVCTNHALYAHVKKAGN